MYSSGFSLVSIIGFDLRWTGQDKIAKDQWRGARVSWDGGGEGGPGKCDSAQDSLLELHLESRKAMNSFKEYIRENCKKKKTAGDLLESEN